MEIEIIEEIETINGAWKVYRCLATYPDGSEAEGFIEGDGHRFEQDTFILEED